MGAARPGLAWSVRERFGLAGVIRTGAARHGAAGSGRDGAGVAGVTRQRWAWIGRVGQGRYGSAGQRGFRQRPAWQAWTVLVWQGLAVLGKAGTARRCLARPGVDRPAWIGRHGWLRSSTAGPGEADEVGRGMARRGLAVRGKAWQVWIGSVQQVSERPGLDRLGRHVEARRGMRWQGKGRLARMQPLGHQGVPGSAFSHGGTYEQ